ncbi:hypothetical protein P353_04215 [Comamonas testosteroni]|uniref:Uncharacterized protein n=1 Tax=Comamonas testosteroni TaxID=285 RepID=A0A096FMS7_COMTE|nr:hypothetical protein P353_04215 [Comamonas testosteroni]
MIKNVIFISVYFHAIYFKNKGFLSRFISKMVNTLYLSINL